MHVISKTYENVCRINGTAENKAGKGERDEVASLGEWHLSRGRRRGVDPAEMWGTGIPRQRPEARTSGGTKGIAVEVGEAGAAPACCAEMNPPGARQPGLREDLRARRTVP